MAGFEHVNVKYPIGLSRWSEIPEIEFNNKKYGFYEIQYIPFSGFISSIDFILYQ